MAVAQRQFIPNQIFVGLPWKLATRYEKIIRELNKKFPIHFTIIGRNDAQDAEDLFEVIKNRIDSSSYAIFDATNGNANVSLEYGYAEGREIERAIYLSTHKATQKSALQGPIISDLTGMRRVQYKTEKALSEALSKLCREHPYTSRFEKALKVAQKNKKKGEKKSIRTLALKMIRPLDGRAKIRRAEFVQNLQASGYKESTIEYVFKVLQKHQILTCTSGRFADVFIA